MAWPRSDWATSWRVRLLSYISGFRGSQVARLLVFSLDCLVNLLPVDWDVLGSVDSQANLVATDVHDRDHYVIADHDTLISVPRKD